MHEEGLALKGNVPERVMDCISDWENAGSHIKYFELGSEADEYSYMR